ncbi:MAG: hypothetical protein WC788_01875 [Candidatus Paceibacterota bacterium]|jgi:hypothetical protein
MLSGQHDAFIALVGTLTTVDQVVSAMNFARMVDEDSQNGIWEACQQAMARVQVKPPAK